MEMVIKLPMGQIKVEGSTQKDLFKQVAEAQEVFGEPGCGLCGGAAIRFKVRTVEENDYFELTCTDPACGARLSFGQTKKGGQLFPKRKLVRGGPDDGKPDMENGKWDGKGRGWTKYRGRPSEGE